MCGGIIKSLFGGGDMPSIPAPIPPKAPPKRVSPETTKAKVGERQRAALAAGRNSTLLTGSQGDLSQASVTGKTLLGQ